MPRTLDPITPGEILLEEFMTPLHLSQNRLARELDVPPVRIHGIVHGKRSITPDTALRLARYFGVSAEFWLNLQARYDLKAARRAVGPLIERRVRARQVNGDIPRGHPQTSDQVRPAGRARRRARLGGGK